MPRGASRGTFHRRAKKTAGARHASGEMAPAAPNEMPSIDKSAKIIAIDNQAATEQRMLLALRKTLINRLSSIWRRERRGAPGGAGRNHHRRRPDNRHPVSTLLTVPSTYSRRNRPNKSSRRINGKWKRHSIVAKLRGGSRQGKSDWQARRDHDASSHPRKEIL